MSLAELGNMNMSINTPVWIRKYHTMYNHTWPLELVFNIDKGTQTDRQIERNLDIIIRWGLNVIYLLWFIRTFTSIGPKHISSRQFYLSYILWELALKTVVSNYLATPHPYQTHKASKTTVGSQFQGNPIRQLRQFFIKGKRLI